MAAMLATVWLAAGCAGGRFVRPAGLAEPFPNGADVWASLSRGCRGVTALKAELRVSGRVGGRGFPTLTAGLGVDADRLALVATAGARPVFNLAGNQQAVVLLNHIDRTTTRGPAADVVEALVGVRLAPARLLAMLTGCASPDPAATAADRVGAYGRVRLPDTVVYLARDGADWRLAAAEFGDVVVEYRRLADGVPRDLEVRRGGEVTLRLRVIEFDRNPPLPERVFSLQVPPAYVEVPVDGLRRDGPLAGAR